MTEKTLKAIEAKGVTIGLCTYKRSSVLETLRSLAQQDRIDMQQVRIVVVDNDEKLFGKPYVEQFAKESGLNVVYVSEPAKNIAAARNRILDSANGLWLAFLDDDEVAETNWLSSLLLTAHQYKADAVIGQVISTYPEATPTWIREGGYFNRKEKPTGTLLEHGNTGCALVNLNKLRDEDIRFNPKFGLTGGEDSDLFFRVHKSAGKIVWCNEAIVSEPIELNRLNGRYLTIRAIRGGQTWVGFQSPFFKRADVARVVVRSIAKIAVNAVKLLVSLPFGRAKYFRPWLAVVDAYGKLTALTGINRVEIYTTMDTVKKNGA